MNLELTKEELATLKVIIGNYQPHYFERDIKDGLFCREYHEAIDLANYACALSIWDKIAEQN